MTIRKYKPSDCEKLIKLFYQTVHTVNSADYSPEQLDVWATGSENSDEWNKSLSEHYTVVAEENNLICGFGDIDNTGYLDRLFVHKDFQRRKIASQICDILENSVVSDKITAHSSVTAKPFFLKRGYIVTKKKQVIRRGIALTNYIMEKAMP
ncbi:MAG: GNAT family N-acetyltransferase [Ruminococcus sp.]|nr:GNAT family N-acetyltransferase [Ruminococcus sp.]